MKKPTIAISVANAKSESSLAVAALAQEMGGIPLVFEDHAHRSVEHDFEEMDACILMGNDLDIDPSAYIHRYPEGDKRRIVHPATKSELACPNAKARAEYEEELVALAMTNSMPMVGICGGMQRINVVLGGTLHQHIPDWVGDNRHCQRTRGVDPHTAEIPILVEGNTMLAEIICDVEVLFLKECDVLSPKVIYENSIHHQSVDVIASGLRRSCLTDTVCEKSRKSRYIVKGIETDPGGMYAGQFILGLQWHPEFCASELGPCIMKRLIAEAERQSS